MASHAAAAPNLVLILLAAFSAGGGSSSSSCGCDLALASYYVSPNDNLTYIASLFGLQYQSVLPYNNIANPDSIDAGSRVSVPFPCTCIGSTLAHSFPYKVLPGDRYDTIASVVYANLTTEAALAAANSYSPNRIPDGVVINVTVSCFCGDPAVSAAYGLFETYSLGPRETLASAGAAFGFSSQDDLGLLQKYNPGINSSSGQGIVFIPTKDSSGSYRPLDAKSAGISGGAIAGIIVGVLVVVLALAICLYFGVYRRKKAKQALLVQSMYEDGSFLRVQDTASASYKPQESLSLHGAQGPLKGFSVDKSVDFSYEELANATDDFSMANKIGSGGFGAVYYAELRGEKVAIKKMDMEASREFLAELKVLTNVHHLNLVRLIGYCIEGSLCLVYEFIDNGNLSEHLRGTARDPLTWAARVQIALDSARGLEYIHEHTVPVYIHRDIKSANILIDKNFRAKVADFGLAKLTEVGSSSLHTRLVGTFGYMPPEYAQYGDVSAKVDVYAFGVVLYELISAKEAVVRAGSLTETQGLVAMFEDALSQSDSLRDNLQMLVDPRLAESYHFDSVYKMALLAKACTEENPQLRPSMRTIVVALMTLSSSSEEWDVDSFYKNQTLVNLMSGR